MTSQSNVEQPDRYLKLTLAYDGTDFCGWQVQASGRSVQGVLETAWQRLTGQRTRITASGRTDAGVHASGQVASVVTASRLPTDVIFRGCNSYLPDDLRLLAVEEAPAGFHAIRDAVGKQYRYWIQDGGVHNVFWRRYCWYLPRPLDVEAMQQAAAMLVGRFDFRAFQASGSDRKTTERDLRQLTVRRFRSEHWIEITTEADGYLYNMVRNLVGTLVWVGQGRRPADWPRRVLRSGDRQAAGPTAPAAGLCLEQVEYSMRFDGDHS